MDKIICQNAKIERITTIFTEMKCDASCPNCKGQCYTEESVIDVDLIDEFINEEQRDIYDHGSMIYSNDLKCFVNDEKK